MSHNLYSQPLTEILLTETVHFHEYDTSKKSAKLFQVQAHHPIKEALESSSMLQGSTLEILQKRLEGGSNENEIYGVIFLLEASKSLTDATLHSIEFGNCQKGITQ